jgi:uncharacterized protein (TIGR02246 family)
MDAQRINAFIKNMQDIWNAGDEIAWAKCFSKDVDFINLFGGYHHGSVKIQASHHHLFNGVFKGSNNVFTVEKVRFLRPDLAAVLVFTALDFKTGHYDGRMTFLMEEHDGDLQIIWFQNTMVTKPAHHGDHARAETVNPDYKPMGT